MIDIHNNTSTPIPNPIAYADITDAVLGTEYNLSLVFCGTHLMRRLNREHRSKDYATTVLSFPLSDTSGEIFICQDICRRQHTEHNRDYVNFMAMLFVHSLVHLKGYDHGATMEQLESTFCARFNI